MNATEEFFKDWNSIDGVEYIELKNIKIRLNNINSSSECFVYK